MNEVDLIPHPPRESTAIAFGVLDMFATFGLSVLFVSRLPSELLTFLGAIPLVSLMAWKFGVWVDIVEAV